MSNEQLTIDNDQLPKGYKQTEVGVIPGTWEVKDFSDFCLLQRGFDITESTRMSGTVPVYSSSGLAYFHKESKVIPPGVVTGRKGILGKVFYIEEPFWPHDTTLWVKDFKGNDAKYVSFYLTYFDLERFDAATSVPTLNRNNLVGIPIPVPPVEEQRSIAQALSDVDALIAALERAITKKRAIKTATMQQLLTGKTRLPGFGEGKGYKETEARLTLPEGWEYEALMGRITITHGFGFQSQYFKSQGTYRLTTPGNFFEEGGFREVEEKQKYYDGPLPDGYLLQHGDLIVAMTEQAEGLLGSAAITPKIGKYLHNQRIGKIKPVSPNVELRFLYYIFNSEKFRLKVRETAAGTKVKHTSPNKLLEIVVPLPPFPEQCAIATVLSDMDAEIAALETRLTKTQSIKQGMMQELLTGRTRLV